MKNKIITLCIAFFATIASMAQTPTERAAAVYNAQR